MNCKCQNSCGEGYWEHSKKYSILGATQPIHFVTVGNGEVTTPDKIVTSCCALVNLCDSVVPLE